jgi:hypothetical protein
MLRLLAPVHGRQGNSNLAKQHAIPHVLLAQVVQEVREYPWKAERKAAVLQALLGLWDRRGCCSGHKTLPQGELAFRR